jgi:hypothetical protein
MRIPIATTTIALIALHGVVDAGPLRACAQVSAQVDGAVRALLVKPAQSESDATQLAAQFHECLSSRNICSVVHDTRYGRDALVAGDVTSDLPLQYESDHGKSSVILLVRSIPQVRTDSNQYCLVSDKVTGATSARQWDVYGWVIAPKAREALPLQKQVLEDKAVSDPRSLRGLAAALWFFAERMSGQPAAYAEKL